MRRVVLGLVLALGLSVAIAGGAAAQGLVYPNYYGYPGLGFSPPFGFGYGNGPRGPAPHAAGVGPPRRHAYPYGFPFGTPPYYGIQGGIGFTFNSLNNAPFSTAILSTNTSIVPSTIPGVQTSLTILPLSAAGRISLFPTGVTTSFNQVIIR